MVDVNTRAGKMGEWGVENKVLHTGARVSFTAKQRLLAFLAENQLAPVKTFFITLKREISYTFQIPNCGKGSHRLDYILRRQTDTRLIHSINLCRSPVNELDRTTTWLQQKFGYLDALPPTIAVEPCREYGRTTSNNLRRTLKSGRLSPRDLHAGSVARVSMERQQRRSLKRSYRQPLT